MLQGAVLAVVHVPGDGVGIAEEEVRDASVLGFLYVVEVDEKRRRLKVLSPVAGRVPSRVVVWGSWPEGVGDLVR